MIIGLTGRIASGKGEVARYFQEKGFEYISLSMAVREEAEKIGIGITRESLQNLGNKFREEQGAGIWAEKIAEKIDESKNYVIDGIRNPAEILVFRRFDKFYLISIDAKFGKRSERAMARGKESDPKSIQEFRKIDERDFGVREPFNGQKVGLCMNFADHFLFNNNSLDELHKKIDKICEKIKC